MNPKRKFRKLKPLALVIPGLVTLTASGTWTATSSDTDNGNPWKGQAWTVGWTDAQYNATGVSVTASRLASGNLRSGGTQVKINTPASGSNIACFAQWDETQVNNAFSEIWQIDGSGNPVGPWALGQVTSSY